MTKPYPNVFQPISIRQLRLKNRLVFLPMTTGLVDDYTITDEFVDFYRQRAEGGVGLTEIGSAYVCDLSGCKTQYPTAGKAAGIWDDRFVPGWRRVADAIRDAGSVSCVQLQICYEWRADADHPLEAVGPSEGPGGPFVKHLRELKPEEIELMVTQYGDAAVRAQNAGFDMVEVHAGIGYQVSRFISSFSNRRTDKYGGSLEKRTRFLTDIIDEVHDRCGRDFPVQVRISADDFMPGGNRVPETTKMMPIIEMHGIDSWSIQVGFHEAPKLLVNQFVPDAAFTDVTRQCKQATKLPVITSYRISTIDRCEQIISDGAADMVGMARQFIADPQFAAKAERGEAEAIRQCIICSRCLDNIFVGKKVQCSVNAQVAHPELGFGAEPERLPGPFRKRVVIVGGGPGGMEAARVAALRGHEVTLLERTGRLGGVMTMAQVLNKNLETMVDWYRREIARLPIDVRLNSQATTEDIRELDPDQIIVSPGGSVIIPDGVPGLDQRNVISSGDLKKLVEGHTPPGHGLVWDLAGFGLKLFNANPKLMRWGMSTPLMIKKRVAVIGGGFAGCELAMAVMHGRQVTVIEENKKLGNGIGIIDRKPELKILKEGGVDLRPSTRLLRVTESGILVENAESGDREKIDVDTVILSLGVESNKDVYDELSASFPNVQLIGDATTPPGKVKRTLEAVEDGYCTAMAI